MSNFPSKKGRPKGSQNVSTASIRSAYNLLINDNLEKLQNDLDEMSGVDRVKCLIALSKFVLPTLNSIDLNTHNKDNFKPVQINFIKDDSK